MQPVLAKTADSAWFQNFVTAVILLAGVVVGIETYPAAVERYGSVLHGMNNIILWIFVAEIAIKMGAHGRRPWRYFLDPWNVFDFLIVALCLLPFGGSFVSVLRLLRVLRVLKLVTALPKLQILVGALLKSIPSMVYVSILLGLLFYLYAVLGTFMFQGNDPIHFPDLQTAMLSLFRVATLEDWTDIMYINMVGCDRYGYGGNEALCTAPQAYGWWSALFFSSFVLMATFVIMNLFIGVIMTGMEEATREVAGINSDAAGVVSPVYARMAALTEQLAQIQAELHELSEEHRKAM